MYSAVSAVHISDMLSELLLAAWIVRFSRVNRLSAENLRETEHFFTLNRSFFAPPLVRGRFEASIFQRIFLEYGGSIEEYEKNMFELFKKNIVSMLKNAVHIRQRRFRGRGRRSN